MSKTSVLFDVADGALIDRRRLRSVVGASADPIAQLIEDLGGDSAVVGIYVATEGVTLVGGKVSQWDDARGAGHASAGPSLVQATDANRPTFNVDRIEFDGVNDRLMPAAGGRLAALTVDGAFALVGSGFGTVGFQGYVSLNENNTVILAAWYNAQVRCSAANLGISANMGAPPAGVRVLHARKSNTANPGLVGGRWGSGAEVVSAGSDSVGTPTHLILGATAPPGSNPGAVHLKAVVVYNGNDYTSGNRYAIVNAFAAAELGATL